MFSFTTCPFCIKAKAILDEKGAKYTVLELDQIADGKAIRAEMGEMLGRTSVPAIWINGEFVGGCNDGPMGGVNTLNSNNQLDEMLKAAGAI
jgi:glutaredoxin 3